MYILTVGSYYYYIMCVTCAGKDSRSLKDSSKGITGGPLSSVGSIEYSNCRILLPLLLLHVLLVQKLIQKNPRSSKDSRKGIVLDPFS